MNDVVCTTCNLPYPDAGVPYTCSRCGGLFDFVSYPVYDPVLENVARPGIWRYRNLFNLPASAPEISLGEGNTPLMWTELFGHRVALKLEGQNPTGSFKDRGSAVLASFLKARKIDRAVDDSSGNAGASFAAYAARCGIKARIYVPDTASGPKKIQIEAYGAEVVLVAGPRSNAADAVQKAAQGGEVYASHAYLPQRLPGYATLAYELWEQLGEKPGSVICPVGQGNLLLGIGRGFLAIQQAGLIDSLPKFIGVQAMACAPLWALSTIGLAGIEKVSEGETVAEGIRIMSPIRGDILLDFMDIQDGRFVAVEDMEIIAGHQHLAKLGFYVEPTSAVVYAALSQVIGSVPEPIVLVLTGSGLKGQISS